MIKDEKREKAYWCKGVGGGVNSVWSDVGDWTEVSARVERGVLGVEAISSKLDLVVQSSKVFQIVLSLEESPVSAFQLPGCQVEQEGVVKEQIGRKARRRTVADRGYWEWILRVSTLDVGKWMLKKSCDVGSKLCNMQVILRQSEEEVKSEFQLLKVIRWFFGVKIFPTASSTVFADHQLDSDSKKLFVRW